jgi:hypothetical protein
MNIMVCMEYPLIFSIALCDHTTTFLGILFFPFAWQILLPTFISSFLSFSLHFPHYCSIFTFFLLSFSPPLSFFFATLCTFGIIYWPMGAKMLVVIKKFRKWSGLSSVQDIIKVTHLSVLTLWGVFVENYYYYKIGGYNIRAQCVVDCNNFFFLWGL